MSTTKLKASKMKNSFGEILNKYSIHFVQAGQHHHSHAGWLNFDCPYCSPNSSRYRMGYNTRGGYLNCWVCGPHNLVETLAKLTGLSFNQASLLVKGLGRTYGKEQTNQQKTRGVLTLPKGLCDLKKVHREYLQERGFDPDKMAKIWKIQGIGINGGRYAWRIFIPAYLNDKVVSWTTRSISNQSQLRYLSAGENHESVPLKSILYGEQYCRDTIIINEGPLDAWAVGPGAVATCGVSFTTAQLLRMSKYPKRVILFDNEPEAQRRAEKLLSDLGVFDGETYNVTLDGKDASRSSKKEIALLRKTFLR